jgi:hypothetical protein
VRFISQLLTGLLSELYGYPEPPEEKPAPELPAQETES